MLCTILQQAAPGRAANGFDVSTCQSGLGGNSRSLLGALLGVFTVAIVTTVNTW
jgi:hypothetical protein